MSLRVCLESGCPALQAESRCAAHARARDKARGTRQQRGYDAQFEAAKRAPEYVNATHCTACGCAFTPDNPKTAGHVIAIRDGGRGSGVTPQCRRCNYGWRTTDL
jgi:hypothetical protein